MFVGSAPVCYLVAIGGGGGNVGRGSGVQPGLCVKTTSRVREEIVSQICMACLQSDRALSRMQWSCPVEVLVGEVGVVVFAVPSVLQAALVEHEKRQLWQEKGPLVVLGDAWQQLLALRRPGSRARSSAVV